MTIQKSLPPLLLLLLISCMTRVRTNIDPHINCESEKQTAVALEQIKNADLLINSEPNEEAFSVSLPGELPGEWHLLRSDGTTASYQPSSPGPPMARFSDDHVQTAVDQANPPNKKLVVVCLWLDPDKEKMEKRVESYINQFAKAGFARVSITLNMAYARPIYKVWQKSKIN
jgi:hypothetical protein